MPTTELNKIEVKTTIQASQSRVWQALTNADQFGEWFSAKLDAPFKIGKRIEAISTHPSCYGKPFYMVVERMEPEHTFAWRWHPGSAHPTEDETTLVEFHLEEITNGTMITVTETGFENISLARRAKAFSENSGGWQAQMDSLQKYVTGAA